MTCLRCNDETVIWYKTSLGWSTCEPCLAQYAIKMGESMMSD